MVFSMVSCRNIIHHPLYWCIYSHAGHSLSCISCSVSGTVLYPFPSSSHKLQIRPSCKAPVESLSSFTSDLNLSSPFRFAPHQSHRYVPTRSLYLDSNVLSTLAFLVQLQRVGINFFASSSCSVAVSGKAARPAIMPPIMKIKLMIDQMTPQHWLEPPYLWANTLASDSLTFRKIRSSHYP